MRLPNTVNVFCGRQLAGKMKEDIMKEVLHQMGGAPSIRAVQVGYEIIRVTFSSPAAFQQAKSRERVQLFDVWCTIQGGGPPPTIVHVFDFPYEGSDDSIKVALRPFGTVKGIRQQTYISNRNVFNGTRMVSLVMENPPPRFLKIDGYNCRTWYRGQPLICNLCNGPGHRSAECPNKDKCRVCGQSGHIGRHCTNAWGGSRTLVESSPPVEEEDPPPPSEDLSSAPVSPPEETPLSCDDSDDSASNGGHSTDDSDNESDSLEEVAESEKISKDVAKSIAHDAVTLNADNDSVDIVNTRDSAVVDDLIDDDSVDDPTVNDDVSVASTTVPSDEDDRSSAVSDDASEVTSMDGLEGSTCAPRKRRHASDGSDEDGGIAAKIAVGSSDELAPLSGDAPADPRSGLIPVVEPPLGASAPEGATHVTDPPGPVLEVSLQVEPSL